MEHFPQQNYHRTFSERENKMANRYRAKGTITIGHRNSFEGTQTTIWPKGTLCSTKLPQNIFGKRKKNS
jgi:hypothetical protein